MFDSGTQKDNMFSGVFAPISSSSEYPYPLTIPDPSLFPPYPASLYKYVKHHMPEKADMLVDAIFEVLFYSSSSKKDTSSARGSLHSIQDRQAKAQETEKGVNKEMDIEKCKEWECMACSYIGWRVPEKRKPSCFQGHRCLSSEEDICFRCRCAKRRAQTAQEDPSRTVEQTRDETGISDPKTTEYRKA
ncbi:hypothetical protein NECID01_1484 [Nematocida sp. AWRm77]|nr:hypothetical protein NECID01_1484 [Nematocida sp. AWRm77]